MALNVIFFLRIRQKWNRPERYSAARWAYQSVLGLLRGLSHRRALLHQPFPLAICLCPLSFPFLSPSFFLSSPPPPHLRFLILDSQSRSICFSSLYSGSLDFFFVFVTNTTLLFVFFPPTFLTNKLFFLQQFKAAHWLHQRRV